jgi:hypothetical protein
MQGYYIGKTPMSRAGNSKRFYSLEFIKRLETSTRYFGRLEVRPESDCQHQRYVTGC